MTKYNLPSVSAKSVLALLPPYPIVLVSTQTNIITINQVMYFTFNPLRVGVAVAHIRYSYELLKEEGEFVINVPDASMVNVVKHCGKISGRAGERFLMTAGHKLPVNKIFGFGLGPTPTFQPQLQHALVVQAFNVLRDAGAHGTILTAPGRAEGLASDMDSLEAVCQALDPSYDFDEVVIVDTFRRLPDAYRKVDLYLKPLLAST